MNDKIKNIIKFLIAVLFFIFIVFLNLAYWAFIVFVVKWILEFFIPDIGWKIPIISCAIYYFVREITLKVGRRR